jgi:two-component system, NarL family, sensor histidine kinase UhpB
MGRLALPLEIGLVLGIAAAAFALASLVELHEAFSGWARRHELWQADELPLALIVLCLGLALFAYRRWRDARGLAGSNRSLARQMIGLRDAERKRLAGELHDQFSQSCNAIRVEAVHLAEAARDPDAVRASAGRIAGTADSLYDLVRGLLRELRPVALDSAGLVAAVQSLCESWEERSKVDCVFFPSGELEGLGEALNMALFRIAQEALSNAMRHARATQVRITLAREAGPPDRVRLRIEDDGRGLGSAASSAGLGLLGMRERAQMLQGRCDLRPRSPRGIAVECVLPVTAA